MTDIYIRMNTFEAVIGEDTRWDTEQLPCYFMRFSVFDTVDTEARIREFVSLAQEYAFTDTGARLCMFSVTEKDKKHKLWLRVAKKLGWLVIPTKSRHDGAYPCWAIVVSYEGDGSEW